MSDEGTPFWGHLVQCKSDRLALGIQLFTRVRGKYLRGENLSEETK